MSFAEKQKDLFTCFVDFEKSFGGAVKVRCRYCWHKGNDQAVLGTESCVENRSDKSDWIKIETGLCAVNRLALTSLTGCHG